MSTPVMVIARMCGQDAEETNLARRKWGNREGNDKFKHGMGGAGDENCVGVAMGGENRMRELSTGNGLLPVLSSNSECSTDLPVVIEMQTFVATEEGSLM
jgi:hypothetical protein